jgi:hypothetical protein
MAKLEDLTPGGGVRGVLPDRAVSVVQAEWHGTQALTLTYRDDAGRVDHELLYRANEAALAIEDEGRAWSFDADGRLFRVASEALRIRLAHLFDPYLAVHTSNRDPLPHQIRAVYGEMLPRQPLRFLWPTTRVQSGDNLHANLAIRSANFADSGPATTGISLPCLAYNGMVIGIEVIGIVRG